MEAAQIVDGELLTSLDDGRVLKLPAERIGRLLAVMADLLDAARRTSENIIELPATEAPSVLDLEDLLTTRWDDAGAIEAYATRFRDGATIPSVAIPARFKAELRPYQQHGVDWLQHLREHGFGAFLADDMGLGKTAQTIAHIAIEHEDGRLDRPALIVVPTSLVTNWTDELTKFAPHLRVTVLHGLDRHAKRNDLGGIHVVITTYTVLARDIEEMRDLPWHIVVLDEAQVIKSPDAKATKAVCQLDTRHRVCLSGTPIENNLQELWSEFAFLMPGLLGDAKGFTKRFRTPIEKNDDPIRRAQLIRRIKPFLLRRTKSEVATDLPPKHTILRHINLAPEQRELYETIRATLQEEVRERIAELGTAQSRIVMLDALLKLRQVCCDPRLVKLASARLVDTSSKLDELMEMVSEMIPEGRRILLFSQFTSMLDLIKPRLAEAGIPFVELRGDTRDRAEPVRAFQAGEVPLFLISLKAGGRGLNLTSADTVIHYDPWWNPAAEDQASDRAHRIGQTKSVFVYKLIAADTVEDRIVELQRRKADLANIALGEEGEIEGIDNDDLAFLFAGPEDRLAA
jgi:SNF2 family DNA or RNA helicase